MPMQIKILKKFPVPVVEEIRMRVGLSFDLKRGPWPMRPALRMICGRIRLADYHRIYSARHRRVWGTPRSNSAGVKIIPQPSSMKKVDIVFNIAEGRGTYRSREAQVPSILEMLDIPYVGFGPGVPWLSAWTNI